MISNDENVRHTVFSDFTRHGWKLACIAVFTTGLAGPGNAAGGKVALCHLPPDNPENVQTISVDEDAVDEHLAHGDFLGACPPTAGELDPPTVTVDPDLQPPAPTIAGIDDGPPRPLVRMNSEVGRGYQFDFVQNELYLITDDPTELDDFMSRWPSTVLLETVLPSLDPAADPTVIHLLNVDPSSANTNRLDRDLATLDSRLYGRHQVSSEAGLQLLALAAGEIRREGLRLGINVLAQSQDFFDGVSEEAMTWSALHDPPLHYAYQSNAFDWPYLNREPDQPGDDKWPLDTGVAHALRAVEARGRLTNRVRVLIADGGFYPNQDFPPYTMVGPLRTTNPDPKGCGAGSPPDPQSSCGTHGTHVLMAGFARPDNAFGTFGPGGAVSDMILVQSPSIDFGAMVDYITESIPAAISERPNIINISASVEIPAGWCFIACEPIDLLVQWLADRGIIVVAAAGNSGIDVDATDQFCTIGCVTFEEAATVPCETDHVICVGAHTYYESRRTAYSNYGTVDDGNSVDIFAPGDVFGVDAIQADETTAQHDDLQFQQGTSYASPFVAGVLALTWASNPALSQAQVRDCVLGAAHTVSFTGERRRINALGAVSCAMGGTHPWVEVLQPADESTFVRGEETVTLQARSDDYEDDPPPAIHWASSLDGSLATTTSGATYNLGSLGLSIGQHRICAETTDSDLQWWDDCIDVTVTSSPPRVDILSPRHSPGFFESDTIELSGRVTDLDDPAPAAIEWRIGDFSAHWEIMTPVATTLTASVHASDFGIGHYTVELRVWDESGAIGSDRTFFAILEDPDNFPPSVTIHTPDDGITIESPDGGPVTVELDASASDPEDGPIDFAEISWSVRIDGGSMQPLTVDRQCMVFDPLLPGECALYGPYTIQLAPVGSQTTTRYDIKGHVSDSDGNINYHGNGWVTVFITQFI